MSDQYEQPGTPQPGAQPGPSGGGTGPASDTSKLLAAIGYPIAIVALVALFIDPYKDEPFVRLHAVQALALAVVSIVASILFSIPIIGWIAAPILYLVVLVAWIAGLVKAFQGEYWEMPVVYDLVKQFV